MERLALIARLKPGTEVQAEELIARGPPFDPSEAGFERHSVYLSATEVVFVFEAHEVEWLIDELVANPFQWMVTEAFSQWSELVDGHPRIARAKFVWQREPGAETEGAAEPNES
jgi:hypothetical protein